MNVEKIGLIGLGKHGSRYLNHIENDFPGLRLHAFCRRDASRLGETAAVTKAKGFAEYGDLIAEGGCDAIVAVVPPHLHLDIVVRATRAGLPLLLEKPAAPSMAAAIEIMRVVRSSRVPLMVAQTLRYNGVVRALRAHLEEIGTITSVALSQRFEPSLLPWLDDPDRAGSGVALHTGVHSFDLLRYLTGREVRSVAAHVSSVNTSKTEDNCAASLELDGGVLATVSLARTTRGRTGLIEISGERGTLAGDHVLQRAHWVRGRAATPIAVGEAVPTVREVLRDFIVALECGGEVPIPLQEGLAAVAVADACVESARQGRTVRVPTFA